MDAAAAFRIRLRQALERRGISQVELSRALQVRAATVTDWLNRGTMPGGAILLRLPALLRVDGHWLLTGEGAPEPRIGECLDQEDAVRARELLEAALEILRAPPATRSIRLREPTRDEALAVDADRARRSTPPAAPPGGPVSRASSS